MGMQHQSKPNAAGKDHGRADSEGIGRKVRRLYGTQPREKEVGFREDIRVPAMRKEETECCI